MVRWLVSNFQHTNNLEQKRGSENGLKAVENGRRGWIEPATPACEGSALPLSLKHSMITLVSQEHMENCSSNENFLCVVLFLVCTYRLE